MKTIAITCVLICMLLSNTASADITYNVTGTVNEVGEYGVVAPPIGIGSTLTGQFTFDVLAPQSGGGLNVSYFPGAATSVSLGISGLPAINITGMGFTQTSNDVFLFGWGQHSDLLDISFGTSAGSVVPTIDGLPFRYGDMYFVDTTNTLFTTNPPPLVNPDQPLLNPAYFSFEWKDQFSINYFFVDGTFAITPVPVPVPGALLLGSIGVGMVGWLKGRKKA